MRKWVILLAVVSLPLVLAAQSTSDSSKADIFGGYSYLRNSGNSFNGWEGQGTYWVTKHVGATADITGEYRTAISFDPFSSVSINANQRLLTYMFGPTVGGRFGKSTVFAHALFGGAHSNLSAGVGLPFIGGFSTGLASASTFAFALGGGLDFGVSKHFAVRPVQIDYLHTNFSSLDALASGFSSGTTAQQNSFRYSAGVVVRF
jgi:outer membrane protein with beta-barrel domain